MVFSIYYYRIIYYTFELLFNNKKFLENITLLLYCDMWHDFILVDSKRKKTAKNPQSWDTPYFWSNMSYKPCDAALRDLLQYLMQHSFKRLTFYVACKIHYTMKCCVFLLDDEYPLLLFLPYSIIPNSLWLCVSAKNVKTFTKFIKVK